MAPLSRLMSLLAWVFLAAGLVVAVTWPTAARLSDHLLEPLYLPDVQGGMYWPWAFSRSLLAGEPIYQRPELMWPAGQDVRLLIWNHGVQLLIFPLFAALDPILATNLSALLIATLNGLAGAWVGRRVSGDATGALVGLCVAVGAPYGFVEAGVGRPEQGLWAPLAVWMGALVGLWRDPADRRCAIIAGLALAAAGAVYWFYAIFALTLLAVTLPLARPGRAHLSALALAGGVSLLAVAPFLLPVLSALSHSPDAISAAVQAADTVSMQSRASILPIGFLGPLAEGEERSWRLPLLLLPALTLALLRGERGVRLVAGSGLLAAVLCAGPVLLDGARQSLGVPLPGAVLNLLPGFERFWWPYRWQAAALAAATVALPALLRHRGLALAVALLSLAEGGVILRDGGQRPVLGRAEVPALFEALGRLEGTHPILQLPGAWLRNSRVGFIPWHGQPIDGGMGSGMGVTAPARDLPLLTLIQRASRDPDVHGPSSFTEAEAGGFHYVIFYSEGPADQRGPLKRGLRRALGEPFYSDPSMIVWAVPGLAEPVVVP
jgi:hypothetical protein